MLIKKITKVIIFITWAMGTSLYFSISSTCAQQSFLTQQYITLLKKWNNYRILKVDLDVVADFKKFEVKVETIMKLEILQEGLEKLVFFLSSEYKVKEIIFEKEKVKFTQRKLSISPIIKIISLNMPSSLHKNEKIKIKFTSFGVPSNLWSTFSSEGLMITPINRWFPTMFEQKFIISMKITLPKEKIPVVNGFLLKK